MILKQAQNVQCVWMMNQHLFVPFQSEGYFGGDFVFARNGEQLGEDEVNVREKDQVG